MSSSGRTSSGGGQAGPARPLDGAKMISIVPPRKVKAVAALLAILVAWGWAGMLSTSSAYTVYGRYLLGFCTILLTLLIVDALQRRYEISSTEIAVRVLFYWRRRTLPVGARAAIDPIGRVIIYDREGKRRLFTIPKEYNLDGQLAQRLQESLTSRETAHKGDPAATVE